MAAEWEGAEEAVDILGAEGEVEEVMEVVVGDVVVEVVDTAGADMVVVAGEDMEVVTMMATIKVLVECENCYRVYLIP